MSDPFSRIREWVYRHTDQEVHNDFDDLMADIDPADDGSPFGWASQACSVEPWWVRAEAPLRRAVIDHRVDLLMDADLAESAAGCGFAFIGKNVNWMTRAELLEELDCSSLAEYYADWECPYPMHIRLIYQVTDEFILELIRKYDDDGADIEGLAMDIIGEDASSEEVIQATDELLARVEDSDYLEYNSEDHHVYEVT